VTSDADYGSRLQVRKYDGGRLVVEGRDADVDPLRRALDAHLAGKRAVDLIGAVVLIGDVVGKQPQVILPGVIRKSNSQVHDAEGILYSKRIMIQLIVDLCLIPIVAAHVHIERQPGKRNIVSRRDIHLPLGCIQARQPIDSLNERSPHSDVATLGKRLSRIAGRRQIGELAVQVSDTGVDLQRIDG